MRKNNLYLLLLLIPSIVFALVLILLSKHSFNSQQAAVDQVPTVLGTQNEK